MEEYERSKRSILKTIRFRLLALGVLMLLLAIVAITLGIVRTSISCCCSTIELITGRR